MNVPSSLNWCLPRGLPLLGLTLCLLGGCSGKQPALEAAPSTHQRPLCEPGQVNELGVGRRCTTNADCAGFKAAMCSFSKGPDRPRMCIVHCDADEQCGPGAMCGIVRGWIRACFPRRCHDYAYSPGRVRPVRHPPAAGHRGAIVVDAGVAFSPAGWGKRCHESAACEGLVAGHCNVAIYPPGVPVCEKECRGAECGDDAYCSYEATRGFSLCLPRSPEPRHRRVRRKPDRLDRCKVLGAIVAGARNEHGVGKPCSSTADCALPSGSATRTVICGVELRGPRRKPDSCTKACARDEDCGRNAVCVDLDRGLPAPPTGRGAEGGTRYCVRACWAI